MKYEWIISTTSSSNCSSFYQHLHETGWITWGTNFSSASDREWNDMGVFENTLCLWKTISKFVFLIVSSQLFCADMARGLFFPTWVWPLTGLQLWVIVRSFFLCQRNREASLGPIEQMDEKETNGWQRLSLANTRPPEGRLESVYGYVCLSAFLFWLSVRTTPMLLYVPIEPSLGYDSVICHVGIRAFSEYFGDKRWQRLNKKCGMCSAHSLCVRL